MSKKLIFPLSLFQYAAHGVGYLLSIFKKEQENKAMRLEGTELDQELERVKQESTNFNKSKTELETGPVDRSQLLSFNYTVRLTNGSIYKGNFDAENMDEVRVFLSNEGYEIINISPRSKFDVDLKFGSGKIKNGDLSFGLIQLSTYIKAGIPLIDSMRILSRQTSKKSLKKIYDRVVYELVMGEPFSKALEKQGSAFPKILINMVKTAEMTGDLSGTLDEMAEYFTQMEKTRKQMISAMVYPGVIFSLSLAAMTFIILFVVPQFVQMFEDNSAELPFITKFIINMSNVLGNYWYIFTLSIILIVVIYRWLFKHIKAFRKTMQTIYMKTPVIGKIIIYNEVATFTRTFASLLNHSVYITDSMEILSQISNNEIYKEIINRTLVGLSKGAKISESFKGEWAFPVVAYEMLVTGESTGQLGLMMEKVAEHYQGLHENAVNALKSLIEPIVICFLAVGVGFIIISIIMPMFDLYNQL